MMSLAVASAWIARRQCRSGNVATIAALAMPVVIGATALAVDMGTLTLERRELQHHADLAAIVAASALHDPIGAVEDYVTSNRLGFAVHAETERDNEDSGADAETLATGLLSVETGRYSADPNVAAGERFRPAATATDAARVTIRQRPPLHFASLFTDAPTLTATGTAHAANLAAFSIGSRLASVDDGILNAVLGSLLGADLSLKVMDYRALLDADIEILSFLDMLATRLDLTGVTHEQLLQEEVELGVFTAALAALDLPGQAGKALDALALSTRDSDRTVPLELFFDAGPLSGVPVGSASALDVEAGVLDILTAAGAIANGDSQIALDLDVGLPGIAAAKLKLAIGETPQHSPWLALGSTGATVRTAQTRLMLDLKIAGTGSLSLVHLPLYVEVAYGEATLTGLTCNASGIATSVRLEARPGLLEAAIGKVDEQRFLDFERRPTIAKARLVDLLLIKIDATAHTEAASTNRHQVAFSANDIATGKIRSVATRDPLGSLLGSLLYRLDADIRLGPIALFTPRSVLDLLGGVLEQAAAPVDTLLVNTLQALGIRLGEADIRVTGTHCARSVLVQ